VPAGVTVQNMDMSKDKIYEPVKTVSVTN